MADQVMGATELAAIIPEIWSARFFDVLLSDLPFISLINKEYEGEIKNLGDVLNIPSVPEFAEANDLAEDGAEDAASVTLTTQPLTINHQLVRDFIVTRKSQLQSQPFMDKLRDLSAYSIMKKVQSLIVAASIPSASAPDHQIAYDSATTLVLADILEIKELLDVANVPAENRQAVMAPAQGNDLFNITGFTSSDFLTSGAGAPLASGKLPPLVGFNVSITNEDVSTNSYWFHPSYMTIAFQQSLDVRVYDLGSQGIRGDRVNSSILMGLKQLDNKRIATLS